MAFLKDNDYKQNCDQERLDVITNLDDVKRTNAENSAISVFKGKLRPKYDVAEIFKEWDGTGTDPRNAALVMHLCNYAQYIMSGSLPAYLLSDDLVARGEEALKWLEEIQRGRDNPDLPLVTNDEGETDKGVIRCGNRIAKSNNSW